MKKCVCKLILIFLLILFSSTLSAQIKGVVIDEKGETIPGVNILIKGSSTGTVTDSEGRFFISDATPNDVLVFSFVGYETKEIRIGNQKSITVMLKETDYQIQELEVVAVGYGDVRRRDLTGSIAKANMSDILKTPVTDVNKALGGRIPGVQVSSKDGGLGNNFSIVIRGAGSLTQSSEPLYVIDGFPVESNMMGTINPNDIASIDVLKDASATAIYGSRGANGVIIITTKQGLAGKPKIEYNGSVSASNVSKKQKLLDGYQFVVLQKELMDDADFEKNYLQNDRTLESYQTEPYYDWQSALYRTAITNNHYISLSGKQGDLQYSTSFSYLNQDGIIINSNLEKYQGRVSLDQKLYNDKLRIRIIGNGSRTIRNGADPTGGSVSISNALMYSVWGYRPISPTGADLMQQLYDDAVEMTEDYRFNPIMTARNEYKKTITDNLNINGMAEYSFTKNLRLRVTGGYQVVYYTNEQFNNSKTKTGFYHPKNTQYKGINAYLKENKNNNWLNENTLTYQFNKKGHNFNTLVGATFQGNSVYVHDMTSTFITNEQFGMAGFGKSSASPTVGASKSENTLMSYLGRINYNYRYKYYATASFRADGSSKFAKKNRWGYFPSASLAWTFSREDFLKDNPILSNGKLRFSYGQTGNNRVEDYAFRGKLYTDDNTFYPFDSQRYIAYIPSDMQNESLKWETTEQTNIGIDVGFFSDRFNITVDLYNKMTRDLLLQADLASSCGYSSAMMNVGELQNRGIEILLETTNIKNKNFLWTSSFNISFNQNQIKKLNDQQIAMTNSVYWDNKYRTMPAYISPVGKSAGLMYGFLYEGTYKNEDFIISLNGKNEPVYTPKKGVVVYSLQTRPGDPKYTDINKDGVINDKDKTIIGCGHPKAIGGLSNDFVYKNFDLNIFFQFGLGNDILNANRMVFENPSGKRHTNMFASYVNRWTEENPTSDMPRSKATGSDQYCSLYIENGSFLRLKSLVLGYNFPLSITKALGLSAIRTSLSVDNLFIITSYSGNDPEVSTRHSVLTPGFDWSPYPRSKDFSLSVNVTF